MYFLSVSFSEYFPTQNGLYVYFRFALYALSVSGCLLFFHLSAENPSIFVIRQLSMVLLGYSPHFEYFQTRLQAVIGQKNSLPLFLQTRCSFCFFQPLFFPSSHSDGRRRRSRRFFTRRNESKRDGFGVIIDSSKLSAAPVCIYTRDGEPNN